MPEKGKKLSQPKTKGMAFRLGGGGGVTLPSKGKWSQEGRVVKRKDQAEVELVLPRRRERSPGELTIPSEKGLLHCLHSMVTCTSLKPLQ